MQIAVAIIVSVLLTQGIKVFLNGLKSGQFNPLHFFIDGGMPSSHSSLVSSLTVSIFLLEGTSASFYLAVTMSALTINDALRPRQRVEPSVDRVCIKPHSTTLTRLKDTPGHTLLEAAVGALTGAIVAGVVHLCAGLLPGKQ